MVKAPPALQTITSSRPRSAITRPTSASTSASAVTSAPRPVGVETGRPELRGHALAPRGVAAREVDGRPELGEGLGHRAAEVRPAAGHDGGAAREVEEGLDAHGADHSSTGRGRAEDGCGRAMIAGMQPVRVAVIGAGFMGERHARIYAGLPDVELVAVCDVREAAARELAARTGAQRVLGLHGAAPAGRSRCRQRVHAGRAPPGAVRAGAARRPSRPRREAHRHHGGRRRGDRRGRGPGGGGAPGGALPPVRPALRSGPPGGRAAASWARSRRSTRAGPTPSRRRTASGGDARSRSSWGCTTTT